MKRLLSLLMLLITFSASAQFCPDLGADQILPCGVGSTTLTADLSDCVPGGTNPNETTDYGVAPIPYVAQTNTGTIVPMSDDSQAGPFPIGFNFCFFGNTYNQFYIGSNGWVSFSAGMPTTFTSATIPSAAFGVPKNCIMAPWQDWHPGLGGEIRYETQGTAPCRTLIVSWMNVPMYSCTGTTGTFHVVIHESSNLIENFIENKQFCAWAGGTGVQGIHNLPGTVGITVPGRNSTVWTAVDEAYAYTPSGPTVPPVLTWYEVGVAIPLGTGPTITVTPPPGGADYTCHFEYPLCNEGWSECNIMMGGPPPDTVNVVPTPALASPLMTFTDPTCNGSCDGTATITPIIPAVGYTYLWNTGETTPTITGLCAGTYDVTADDGNGCITTGTVTITDPPLLIAPPIIAPPIICFGSTSEIYSVTPIAGMTYTWVTTGTINSGQGTDIVDLDLSSLVDGINPNAVGVFITDVNGCVSDTVFIDVEVVDANPTIDLIGPFCSNDPCVTLVGTPAGGAFTGIGVSGNTYCPIAGSSDITYTYMESGCTFDTTISVVSNLQPSILSMSPIEEYLTVCEDEPLSITYTVETTLPGTTEWLFDGGMYTSDNLNITWENSGSYLIEVVHYSNGCPSEPFTRSIIVSDCPNLIYYIPNAFTPDGDEYNEVWLPVFTKGFDPYDYHLTVFNRWGEMVWESYDASVGWDGKYNGKVQDGTYVWRVEFGDSHNDKKYMNHGHVTVLK
ncbi:MAG: putative cell envelope proteinase [uncultured marine phage]|uniref:Putative cell envelope proteinase n=1 Tax=uncultured marine phage TaxID=707152 RepID=A0A8D9C8Y0_9VIRU|nr:MAG: putative cell envelope proteinase [uncultured marine phage]